MLSRRYVERKIEKRAYWNPVNGRVYVEGIGLLQNAPDTLAEAVCLAFAYECQVLYLLPQRGRWHDKRGQYPGKADWGKSGLELAGYYRNHSATIALGGGEFTIDIIPIGIWFPSFTEDMYMSDVIKAMHTLKDLLTRNFQPMEVQKGKHEEYRVELQSTPARTGMDLLRRKLPYGVKYEDLPADVEHIIMTEFGQARTELFDHGWDQVENLHNYDGLWMYASCCRNMPIGSPIYDKGTEYMGYMFGLYHVTAIVPNDWNHVGLLPVREEGKTIYPNDPNGCFSSWCSHRDVKLAMDYGWDIQIFERILWPDTLARGIKGQDPLRHWMETLVRLREEVASQYEEPIRGFLRDAFRSLLNQTIGRLHMGGRKVDIYTEDFEEDPGDGAFLAEEYLDGTYRYEKREELNAYQKEGFKPHWSLAVWSMAKWKVTKAALEVPYDQLVSIRTDGLWTTCSVSFDNTGKPGCFRRKELKNIGPFSWPHNGLEFVNMIQKARNG